MATATATWRYVVGEINGFPLAYRICGDGKPIVFLHGFGTTSASWLRCAELLPGEYRKILLDLPGHGRSGHTLPEQDTIQYCTAAITACLRQPDWEHGVVAAHSFGGYLLLRALIDNQADPSAIILADIPAFPQRPPKVVNFFANHIGSSLAFAVMPLELLTWLAQREVFYDTRKIPSLLIKEYAGALRTPGTLNCLQNLATAIGSELKTTTSLSLHRLSIPTLILWGSHDRLVPLDSGRRLHEALPKSELHILPATGHAPQEESPQETATLIQAFFQQIS